MLLIIRQEMANAARALTFVRILIDFARVATKKPTASDAHTSQFVLFGAVYCTNLARSPLGTAQILVLSAPDEACTGEHGRAIPLAENNKNKTAKLHLDPSPHHHCSV